MHVIRLGTRGSRLAVAQASWVAELLRPRAAPHAVELVEIVTAGDQVRDVPLPQIGGDGVFTREIQRALLAGDVDVAVHSLKDLPTAAVPGLALAAVPARAPVGDVLIAPQWRTFSALPVGGTVATSSLRRAAQAWHARPDLKVVSIRGNVETRLARREELGLDGLILAEAGLGRLGLEEVITERLDVSWMLPAVGQGALGLECREDDRAAASLLKQVDDPFANAAVAAEREMLRALGGGCQVPIGVVTRIDGQQLTMQGVVLSPDGRQRIEGCAVGLASAPVALGRRLAEELGRRGAAGLLGA